MNFYLLLKGSRMSKHKYSVAPKKDRTWNGRTYDSKAEREYAQCLDALKQDAQIIEYIHQPRLWLGVPENIYVPDFFVVPTAGPPYYVDVKGMETQAFKRVKKLWAKYGDLDLVIIKRKGPAKFKVAETIHPN
jgi:hypothetical protein